MSVFTAIAYVVVGNLVLCALVTIARNQRDAWIGRRLIKAAGNEELAQLAILEAARERQLREKALAAATDAFMTRGLRTGVALRMVKP